MCNICFKLSAKSPTLSLCVSDGKKTLNIIKEKQQVPFKEVKMKNKGRHDVISVGKAECGTGLRLPVSCAAFH